MRKQPPTRGALVGATISAVFGGLWALWASTGAAGPPATVIAAVGLGVGVIVAVTAVLQARRARPDTGPSMFSTTRYRLIVGGEVAAIVVGDVLLSLVGESDYLSAWTAVVVGVHFLMFGYTFSERFIPIGWWMVAAGGIGAVAGIAGGSDVVALITGVISAVTLLVAGARTVLLARRFA